MGVLQLLLGGIGVLSAQYRQADSAGATESQLEDASLQDNRPTVPSARIERGVVAGIVLPLATGFFLVLGGSLSRLLERTRSWHLFAMMAALPAGLMLLLAFERLGSGAGATLSARVWGPEAIPTWQLLLSAAVEFLVVATILYQRWPQDHADDVTEVAEVASDKH